MPTVDTRAAVPGYVPPPEKHGIQLPVIGRRRFLAGLLLTGATILGAEEGLSRIQQQEGWITQIAKTGASWWEERLQQNAAAQRGETFNPNAPSGEITAKNSIVLSLEEALKLVESKGDEIGYIVLPQFGDNVLEFVNKYSQYGNTTEVKGLPPDVTFVSLYDGYLSWSKYEQNDYMSVKITKGRFGIDKPEDLRLQIEYRAKSQNLDLFFPEDAFTVREIGQKGMRTFYTSQIPIKAGQPIFRLTGDKTINMYISRANILSDNNKAVTVPSS